MLLGCKNEFNYILIFRPLLTTPNSSQIAQILPKQSQSTSQLLRNQSKVRDIQQKSTVSLINHTFPTSKSLDLSLKTDFDTEPIKICLRKKKRERQNSLTEKWRSSTTILDSLYKDLSKSILTIDDVRIFHSIFMKKILAFCVECYAK